jgi:hypothetical protein
MARICVLPFRFCLVLSSCFLFSIRALHQCRVFRFAEYMSSAGVALVRGWVKVCCVGLATWTVDSCQTVTVMAERGRSRSRARVNIPKEWSSLVQEIMDVGTGVTLNVTRSQTEAVLTLVHQEVELRLKFLRESDRESIARGLHHLASFYGVVVETWGGAAADLEFMTQAEPITPVSSAGVTPRRDPEARLQELRAQLYRHARSRSRSPRSPQSRHPDDHWQAPVAHPVPEVASTTESGSGLRPSPHELVRRNSRRLLA